MTMEVFNMYKGINVDKEGRCAHYNKFEDIVSYQFPNDNAFYPCHKCYEVIHHHLPKQKYTLDSEYEAVLCGHCNTTIPVNKYIGSDECPRCNHPFNPGCKNHYHLYFSEK